MSAGRSTKSVPPTLFGGVRWLASLRASDVSSVGEEAAYLGRLSDAGVPIAAGCLVPLTGADARAGLAAAISHLLEEPNVGGTSRDARSVEVRSWFVSRAVASRCSGVWPVLGALSDPSQAMDRVSALLDALSGPSVRATVGPRIDGALARLVVVDRSAPSGTAASADPTGGDPDLVAVWTLGASAWLVDRRTMRVTRDGTGSLDPSRAARVSDLADRAQLVLGRPVEIEWVHQGARPVIAAVRPLTLVPAFTTVAYRRVALVAADEGTVAPLAVDALSKSLGRDDDPSDAARVQRTYARPYRRADDGPPGALGAKDSASIVRAAARAARVAADVTAPIAAARRFELRFADRLAPFDSEDLPSVDAAQLLTAIRERQRLAVEAFTLLDRLRLATLAVLPALEAAGGNLPREAFAALAAPRHTRARRRIHERLARLAARIESEAGELVPPDRLSHGLRRRWEEVRRSLRDVRPLGIDVRPRAIGSDDVSMLAALRTARFDEDEAMERARRDAVRRVRATARAQPLGAAREAIVTSVTVLLARVAEAKGSVSEGLAASLLRLRRAACEAGRRLVDKAVLDHADDALFMDLAEIEQALGDEPGAYAARVKLRREEDQRWLNYEAPRKLRPPTR